MKKILITLAIFGSGLAGYLTLGHTLEQRQQQFEQGQKNWGKLEREYSDRQRQQAALASDAVDWKREARSGAAATMDGAVADFLLTHDASAAPLQLQNKMLAGFGSGDNSSKRYVLVSKAALANIRLKMLKNVLNEGKLTEAARGVLAITPEEAQAVEAAIADEYQAVADWAKANSKRDGPAEKMLFRYTLPADAGFEDNLMNRLYSSISAAVGNERGELIKKYYGYYRIDEDGFIGDRTNIFEIYRLAGEKGYGVRSGWQEADGGSTVNTYPEPIRPNRFPRAFQFIFPDGWTELAEREGLELPEGFKKKP